LRASARASDLSETGAAPLHNVAKTLLAVVWMYGGRGVGLLWTLALTTRLGVGEYGLYGMGYALMSIVGPPLDNPFTVRTVRESEDRFVAERTCRFLVGVAVMLGGLALFPVAYIGWFGLFVAGGELAFGAYKSRAGRDGHPQRVWRMDSARQATSVALACAYLYGTAHPTLLGASLLYCTPYVVIVLMSGLQVRGYRPALPGPPKLIAILVGEVLGMAVYMQGDVLLLGWLTNSTTVGYYTLTWVVTAALAAVGPSFGMTYYEALRHSGGDLSAGPPLRNTVLLGTATGLLALVVGVGLLISPAPTELAVAMMIMAGFCAMRTVNSVFMAILYAQRRDVIRMASSVGLVPVKLGIVAALASAGAGAVGAAIASVITDAVLLLIYSIAIYRKATA
jgi:O-antigen/teichoic acid export membrane protein